jgi:hypothetical protein
MQPIYQGECGSCWSFATVTTFSDRIRIHSKIGTHKKLTLCLYDKSQIQLQFKDINKLRFHFEPYFRNAIIEDIDEITNKIPLMRDIEFKYPITIYNMNTGKTYEDIRSYKVKDTLSPYYFAACDICELGKELDPAIDKYLKDKDMCSMCCDGGIIQFAHVYLVLRGCIALSCDPEPFIYSCTDYSGCPIYRAKYVYQVNDNFDWENITTYDAIRNEELIMRDIRDNGPVVASIAQYPNFQDGNEGWYKDIYVQNLYSMKGGHAITIIGWGSIKINIQKISNSEFERILKKPHNSMTEKEKFISWAYSYAISMYGEQIVNIKNNTNMNIPIRYWICRNTWGQNWRNGGYFKMLKGVNLCGIEQDVWAAMPLSVYDTRKKKPTKKINKKNKYCNRKGIPISNEFDENADNVKIVENCDDCIGEQGIDCYVSKSKDIFDICSVENTNDNLQISNTCKL